MENHNLVYEMQRVQHNSPHPFGRLRVHSLLNSPLPSGLSTKTRPLPSLKPHEQWRYGALSSAMSLSTLFVKINFDPFSMPPILKPSISAQSPADTCLPWQAAFEYAGAGEKRNVSTADIWRWVWQKKQLSVNLSIIYFQMPGSSRLQNQERRVQLARYQG